MGTFLGAGIDALDKAQVTNNEAMQRFTISLDDTLAGQFDALTAAAGYVSRSEAVRDLIRLRLDRDQLQASRAAWCVATVSFVYDHHDRTVCERVQSLQHGHHELVVTSLHHHLDHDHCLETVVLRGQTPQVNALSQQLIALRGVRHGSVHQLPLDQSEAHVHLPLQKSAAAPPDAQPALEPPHQHRHLRPLS